MEELSRLIELVGQQPGATTVDLRDALRRDGRSSMTIADVDRTLLAANDDFVSNGDVPRRWWPASAQHGSRPVDAHFATAAVVTAPAAPCPELYSWQKAALNAWHAAGCRGVVEAVTGAGKTMIGLVAAQEEAARRGQVVIIVPTRELLAQWAALLRSMLPAAVSIGLLGDGSQQGLDSHDIVVAVVNSARIVELRPRRPGGLLVADECHRYGSAQNSLVLSDRFPRRLGLSATFARSDNTHLTLLEPYLGGVCYRVDYAAATRDGVIAAFDVVLVAVDFSPEERASYGDLTQQMAVAVATLVSRGHIPHDATDAFFGLLSALARGHSDAADFARAYMRAMQERRQLLDNASAKLAVLATLAPSVGRANRTIVFTQTVAAAEVAAATLRANGQSAAPLHSQLSPPERKATMDSFRQGRIVALAAPQVLDEGVDVPEADLAIVLGASRSRRQMVQRMGRVLRPKSDERRARFVIVSVRGTVEDPERGAHEMFLDEVVSVARSVDTIVFGEQDLGRALLP